MPIADTNSRKVITVPNRAYNDLVRYLLATGNRDFSAYVREALTEKARGDGLNISFQLDSEKARAQRVDG
jgi:hypothetical protein